MPTHTSHVATPSQPVDLVTADLALTFALADAAKQMAERASQENDPNVRVALRNQSKVANEQAGLLLARGAVTLFNGVPADAATQIAEAVDGVSEAIAGIKKAKNAISFVTSLVGVAGAVLLGYWAGVA